MEPVSAWLSRVLDRIHKLANQGKVRFTAKAINELRGLDLGLGAFDAIDILVALAPTDAAGRLRSSVSSEWLYVFKPTVAEIVLYVKVVLRADCVVVSFHKDQSDEEGS
jgi:hypothetical protein